MLGCRLNRMENMRKLARSCAYRLSKEYLEKEAMKMRQETKKKEESNKFSMKTTKPRSTNTNLPVPVNPNLRKKIDNVNT